MVRNNFLIFKKGFRILRILILISLFKVIKEFIFIFKLSLITLIDVF